MDGELVEGGGGAGVELEVVASEEEAPAELVTLTISFQGNLYSDSRGKDENGRVTKFSRTLAPYVFPDDCSTKNPHQTPYS